MGYDEYIDSIQAVLAAPGFFRARALPLIRHAKRRGDEAVAIALAQAIRPHTDLPGILQDHAQLFPVITDSDMRRVREWAGQYFIDYYPEYVYDYGYLVTLQRWDKDGELEILMNMPAETLQRAILIMKGAFSEEGLAVGDQGAHDNDAFYLYNSIEQGMRSGWETDAVGVEGIILRAMPEELPEQLTDDEVEYLDTFWNETDDWEPW